MVKVGLFGIGLDTYWPQFEGLKDRLIEYQNTIKNRMISLDADVYDAGLVDNPEISRAIGYQFREENVEIIFCFVATYALSHTVLPVLQSAKVPVVLLNLQPVPFMDYDRINALKDRGKMTGEWLAHCQACSVPEIANVCNRSGIQYEIISGYLEEDYAWRKIDDWLRACEVHKKLTETRFGILGHYYCGMLDVYTDITALSSVFGSHFELLEMDQLKEERDLITNEQIKSKRKQFEREFKVSQECSEMELDRAAKTSCALDALVADNNLHGVAYYYEGTSGSEYEDLVTSVIAGNTLLTAHHVPVAGECEIKNIVAMKIMDILDCGGSFSELYAIDFADDVILWGHDGPAHPVIADGDVGLVPLPVYHGKPGKGLSIQMSVKNGPVTLLAVVQGAGGRTFLLVAEGESVPGPILEIGNTNSRYKFSLAARDFINEWSKQGPSHHCAIGVGHQANRIKNLAFLLGIDCIQIC